MLDVVRAVCAAGGRPDLEPDVRGTGTPDGEIDRQWVDAVAAAGAHRLGAAGRRSTTVCGARIAWYREHPQRLAAA